MPVKATKILNSKSAKVAKPVFHGENTPFALLLPFLSVKYASINRVFASWMGRRTFPDDQQSALTEEPAYGLTRDLPYVPAKSSPTVRPAIVTSAPVLLPSLARVILFPTPSARLGTYASLTLKPGPICASRRRPWNTRESVAAITAACVPKNHTHKILKSSSVENLWYVGTAKSVWWMGRIPSAS